MVRTWAFCLETNAHGNFADGSRPPNHGVFWVTGDVTGAAPFTFSKVIYLAADDAPIFYDGDQIFYAVGTGNLPTGQAVQDIVVTLGRLRNIDKPLATVGSPVKFPSGSPRCMLNKDINGGALTTLVLPGPGPECTRYAAIGPITFNKDPGVGRPPISRFESLVVARIGTAPHNITAEFAFDPEADVDNGL
jgi:hypothetical protein